MTEDEATTKWCPMVRHNAYYSGNRMGDEKNNLEGICTCMGSQCMMWRWDCNVPDTNDGYCGLAGKP